MRMKEVIESRSSRFSSFLCRSLCSCKWHDRLLPAHRILFAIPIIKSRGRRKSQPLCKPCASRRPTAAAIELVRRAKPFPSSLSRALS
jgi:hypothetical protein